MKVVALRHKVCGCLVAVFTNEHLAGYFALDGTDHPDHATQSRMIRRYIAWRNRNAHDRHLRRVVNRANVA